jgi:hypothetical protein
LYVDAAEPCCFFLFLLLAFLGLRILGFFFQGGRVGHGLGLVCFLNLGLLFCYNGLFGVSENLTAVCMFLLGACWYYAEHEFTGWDHQDLIISTIFGLLVLSGLIQWFSNFVARWTIVEAGVRRGVRAPQEAFNS